MSALPSDNGDDLTQEERLEKYTGPVDWSYLAPHQKLGHLYHLDLSQNLADVGKLFIHDKREAVDALLKSGDLTLMGDLHAEWFVKNPQMFTAVIVTPFIICQPLD